MRTLSLEGLKSWQGLGKMYEVFISHEAEKYYKGQDKNTKRRLNKCIDNLSREPFSGSHIKRLHGELEGKYRARNGQITERFGLNQFYQYLSQILLTNLLLSKNRLRKLSESEWRKKTVPLRASLPSLSIVSFRSLRSVSTVL